MFYCLVYYSNRSIFVCMWWLEWMLDWWIETRLEGDQFEVAEDQLGDQQYQEVSFEEGKCSKGPLYPWTL